MPGVAAEAARAAPGAVLPFFTIVARSAPTPVARDPIKAARLSRILEMGGDGIEPPTPCV